MANLKTNENQHLGKQELNRLKKFIVEDGYKLLAQNLVENYGIPKLPSDANFENLKIVSGTGVGALTLKAGIAFDKDMLFIRNISDASNVLTNANDGVKRFIKIAHQYSKDEIGTVTLATDGTLVGVGTKFTEVFRGGKRAPVKVRLADGNEYEVLSVTDDLNANLNGSTFTAISNAKFSVVGTFDIPTVPASSKNIYEYDSYSISLVTTETVVAGKEFILASVQTTGGVTTIVDKRNKYSLSLLGTNASEVEVTQNNSIVGVEWAKVDHKKSDRGDVVLKVGYGFRSSNGNWTANASENTLTISSGSGGVWADKTPFSAGYFDNWIVYFNNGRKSLIEKSELVGGDIKLTLENYDTSKYPTSGNITVNPDADSIKFILEGDVDKGMFTGKTISVTHDGFDTLKVSVGEKTNIKFSMVKRGSETPLVNINSGNYVNESSFDDNGVLGTAVNSAVTSGDIVTLPSDRTLAVHGFRNNDNNNSVGQNSFSGKNTFTGEVEHTNTSDTRLDGALRMKEEVISSTGTINDHTVKSTRIMFTGSVIVNGFAKGSGNGYLWLQVAQGGNTATLKNGATGSSVGNRIATPNGGDLVIRSGESILLLHDTASNVWRVTSQPYSLNLHIHKEIKWIGREVTQAQLPLGWFIADGNNGTDNLIGRMIIGKDASQGEFDLVAKVGGAKTHTLTENELPSHNHSTRYRFSGAEQDDQIAFLQPEGWTDTTHEGEGGGDPTTNGHVDVSTKNTGNGQAHNNLPPYFVAIPIQYIAS